MLYINTSNSNETIFEKHSLVGHVIIYSTRFLCTLLNIILNFMARVKRVMNIRKSVINLSITIRYNLEHGF